MRSGEWKEDMLEVPAFPAGGCMAALAIGCPAVCRVVGAIGLCEIPLMTELALRRSAAELAHGRLEVAALAWSYGMCGH
jgi:hypothetical protein